MSGSALSTVRLMTLKQVPAGTLASIDVTVATMLLPLTVSMAVTWTDRFGICPEMLPFPVTVSLGT